MTASTVLSLLESLNLATEVPAETGASPAPPECHGQPHSGSQCSRLLCCVWLSFLGLLLAGHAPFTGEGHSFP